MSVFPKIPSEFPFDVDLSERPTSYRLQIGRLDAIVAIALALLWIVVGTIVLLTFMEILAAEFPAPSFWYSANLTVCIAYLTWAIFFYFGPEILVQLRAVVVTIGKDHIDVVEHGLLSVDRWSRPLSEFQGVALFDLGTQLIDSDKRPVASIMLQHTDPARSVPISFHEQGYIGQKTVRRIADQLGMTAIDGVSGIANPDGYKPGTIVVNQNQAMKVRIFYWLVMVLGAFIVSSIAYLAATETFDPSMLWLVVLVLVVMVPMHVYASVYVTQMNQYDETVFVTTAALLGANHKLNRNEITGATSQKGKLYTVKHRINTPWVNLWVRGRKLPFIVDMQSDYVATKLLFSLTQNRKQS